MCNVTNVQISAWRPKTAFFSQIEACEVLFFVLFWHTGWMEFVERFETISLSLRLPPYDLPLKNLHPITLPIPSSVSEHDKTEPYGRSLVICLVLGFAVQMMFLRDLGNTLFIATCVSLQLV